MIKEFLENLDFWQPATYKGYSICKGITDTYTIVGRRGFEAVGVSIEEAIKILENTENEQ